MAFTVAVHRYDDPTAATRGCWRPGKERAADTRAHARARPRAARHVRRRAFDAHVASLDDCHAQIAALPTAGGTVGPLPDGHLMRVSPAARFFRTVLTIYSDSDPGALSLEDLGREADRGGAICTDSDTAAVPANALPEAAASFFDVLG